MEVRAVAKDTGIPPRKVRRVIDLIRGKKVGDALTILKFTPTPAAKAVAKAVKSAAANADNNLQMDPANLKIVGAFSDAARTLKRIRPKPRGQAGSIFKRSSHITIIVSEQGE